MGGGKRVDAAQAGPVHRESSPGKHQKERDGEPGHAQDMPGEEDGSSQADGSKREGECEESA